MTLVINVKKINENAKLPFYATEQAVGADLFSTEEVELAPECHALVGTGIAVQPDRFCDMQIRPRSGLAAKHKVTVLNAPGTVDPDYRLEIKVILMNHGKEIFKINVGDRIAQIVTNPLRARFIEVQELNETSRIGGFGSTGQ